MSRVTAQLRVSTRGLHALGSPSVHGPGHQNYASKWARPGQAGPSSYWARPGAPPALHETALGDVNTDIRCSDSFITSVSSPLKCDPCKTPFLRWLQLITLHTAPWRYFGPVCTSVSMTTPLMYLCIMLLLICLCLLFSQLAPWWLTM